MYALVDANSFYCSAEQVFRPDWRGKPIIVLSNNDGCIVAANRQARELGIPKFAPYFHVKEQCAKLGVIVCSSNYELYADLSAKMMEIIGRFAPDQHIYSIDESFLSFKHCHASIPCLKTHGLRIRQTVWKEARLPVCVGIGATLTLAKIANHAAKKLPGYNGVCFIDNDLQRIEILKQLLAADVWGIGRRLSKKLTSMGIHTAYELAQMPTGLARKQFSIEIERTVRELNGTACKQWDHTRADKQQIFSTRSVGERIMDFDSLRQALSKHIGIAAAKARAQGSCCRSMLIFANNSPYDEQPVGFKSLIHFTTATNCTIEMTHAMSLAAPTLFKPGVKYYKIGVGLLNLEQDKYQQLDLFNRINPPPTLMKAFDGINARYGRDTLFLAAQGIEQKWAMRRALLTPQYTTLWGCIPRVKC